MSVGDALTVGAQDHPEAFQMAVRALELYERDCTVLQETNKFDFRRGFELGYYTAMHTAARTDSFGGGDCCQRYASADDMDCDEGCPICGAEPGQQCSEPDPDREGFGVELGGRVHVERLNPHNAAAQRSLAEPDGCDNSTQEKENDYDFQN